MKIEQKGSSTPSFKADALVQQSVFKIMVTETFYGGTVILYYGSKLIYYHINKRRLHFYILNR